MTPGTLPSRRRRFDGREPVGRPTSAARVICSTKGRVYVLSPATLHSVTTTPVDGMAGRLRALPQLLADEPALGRVLGRASTVLAVPEAARAIAVAGLATVSERSPFVVAVPTTSDAERL